MDPLHFFFLIFSAMLFAGQFICKKYFQLFNGTGFGAALRLTVLTNIVNIIFFLIKNAVNGFSIEYTHFTFFIALILSLSNSLFAILGLKVIAVGDLAIYSVFMMLGSTICGALTGIIFNGDPLSLTGGIALVLMVISIVLSVKGSKNKKFTFKSFLLYMSAFLMNGVNSALCAIHVGNPQLSAGSTPTETQNLFMFWRHFISFVITLVMLIIMIIVKIHKAKKQGFNLFGVSKSADPDGSVAKRRSEISKSLLVSLCIFLPILLGICNGLGDYFQLIGMDKLGSIIAIPVVNGGVIVFSTLTGILLFKEKATPLTIISIIMTIVSMVLFYI